jgi:hypothetical protein
MSPLKGRPTKMQYQLTWKILPGLRGMSCSEFSATATNAPNNEQGVAFECAGDAERNVFLSELESHFAAQRFSNNASAFEMVKTYVLEWNTRRVL